jgi:hypothetical protein
MEAVGIDHFWFQLSNQAAKCLELHATGRGGGEGIQWHAECANMGHIRVLFMIVPHRDRWLVTVAIDDLQEITELSF